MEKKRESEIKVQIVSFSNFELHFRVFQPQLLLLIYALPSHMQPEAELGHSELKPVSSPFSLSSPHLIAETTSSSFTVDRLTQTQNSIDEVRPFDPQS